MTTPLSPAAQVEHLNRPLTEADRKDLGLPSAELEDGDGIDQFAPDAAPVATDEGNWFAVALMAQDMRSRGLAEQIAGDELLKLANRQRGAAQPPAAQPAPPAAPAGGLVERVEAVIRPSIPGDPNVYRYEARAAIREVAAWMRENETGYNAVRLLEQEASR